MSDEPRKSVGQTKGHMPERCEAFMALAPALIRRERVAQPTAQGSQLMDQVPNAGFAERRSQQRLNPCISERKGGHQTMGRLAVRRAVTAKNRQHGEDPCKAEAKC